MLVWEVTTVPTEEATRPRPPRGLPIVAGHRPVTLSADPTLCLSTEMKAWRQQATTASSNRTA